MYSMDTFPKKKLTMYIYGSTLAWSRKNAYKLTFSWENFRLRIQSCKARILLIPWVEGSVLYFYLTFFDSQPVNEYVFKRSY